MHKVRKRGDQRVQLGENDNRSTSGHYQEIHSKTLVFEVDSYL
jgi:hypothetical protein